MKQTAVDWLFEQFFKVKWDSMKGNNPTIFEKAKQMEKEQIKESYDAGVWEVGCRNADSEQYYKETYEENG